MARSALAQTERHLLLWGHGAETLDAVGVEGDVVAAGDPPFPSICLAFRLCPPGVSPTLAGGSRDGTES
jgi:hypothetical protein